MRRRHDRVLRGGGAGLGVALLLLLLALLTPCTSGALIARITNSANAASTKGTFTCADRFSGRRSQAFFEYALDDQGTIAADSSDAADPGTYESGTTPTARAADTTTPVACKNDAGTPWKLSTTSNVTTTKQVTLGGSTTGAATEWSIQLWLKLSSTATGKIAGLEMNQTGVGSASYGKRLSLYNAQVYYCLDNGSGLCLISAALTANTWYLITATTSASGSALYINTTSTTNAALTSSVAGSTTGYWRLGQGQTSIGTDAVQGSMRYAAAYPFALTAAQVSADYTIGTP